jgi:basic membrane protein A
MRKRNKWFVLILAVLVFSVFMGCAKTGGNEDGGKTPVSDPGTSASSALPEKKPKLVVISNRSFGDKGPIDSQSAVLPEIESMGFETKTLESLSADVFEEDIRAMAKAGYDVIVTSFPPVSEAVVSVAKDYPDVKFASIYQFTNAGDDKISNIWSTEYKAQEMLYLVGCCQGKLTKTNKVGIISGQETASSNAGINGYMDGVMAANPECEVEFMFAGTYDDPTIGREIALAMINKGIDVIATSAGRTSTGVVEACQENGVMMIVDNGDFYDLGNNAMVTYFLTDFGQVVKQSAIDYLNGEFKGGEHTIMSIFNGGAVVKWDLADRFIENNPDKKDLIKNAVQFAKDQEEKVISGEVVVEFKPDTPEAIRRD